MIIKAKPQFPPTDYKACRLCHLHEPDSTSTSSHPPDLKDLDVQLPQVE